MRPTYNNKTKKRRRSKNYKTQRKICDFGDIALFQKSETNEQNT